MAVDRYKKGKEQKRTMMGKNGKKDAILDSVTRAEGS